MPFSMKLFVTIWLVTVLRVAATGLAGRQCLRIRTITKNRMVYEWFTALAIGMFAYSLTDFALILNGIFNGPPNRATYPTKVLWISLALQIVQSLAMWTLAFVLLNGGAPGWIRRMIFAVLGKFPRVYAPPDDPKEKHP